MFFSLMATLVSAQSQPAHFSLGEESLEGLEIYDIAQNSGLDYIISTNEGLYVYDFVGFHRLECPSSRSLSFFDLTPVPDGSMFCHNLNQQVFRIKGEQCTLFYTLPKELQSANQSLAIAPGGDLIVAARGLLRLDSKGNVKRRLPTTGSFIGAPFVTKLGQLIYHLPSSDSVWIIGEDWEKKAPLRLQGIASAEALTLHFFRVGDKSYAIDLKTHQAYRFDDARLELTAFRHPPLVPMSPNIRVYDLGEQTWLAGTQPGAYCLREGWEDAAPQLLFPNLFISNAFLDAEGNTVLGTFGTGLRVVPDFGRPDVWLPSNGNAITALKALPNSKELYIGRQSGQVLRYSQDRIDTLQPGGRQPVQVLVGSDDSPFVFWEDGTLWAWDRSTAALNPIGEWSLKDGSAMDSGWVILGTNRGVLRCRSAESGLWDCGIASNMNMRVYQVERCGDTAFVSTSLGVRMLKADGTGIPLLWLGEEVFPTAMQAIAGRLVLVTADGDLLVAQEGQLIKVGRLPTTRWGLCRKFLPYRDGYLALTAQEIYLLDWDGSVQSALGQYYGLPKGRLLDMALMGDQLWVSVANGLQFWDLREVQLQVPMPELRLASLRVNGQDIAPTAATQLSSDQRKLEFTLAIPSLRHRATQVQYRLLGNDVDWMSQPNDGNPITYNALEAGEYELVARTTRLGLRGPELRYKFQIATPYYRQWWFVILMALAGIVILSTIFLRILHLQRRKAERINELNLSKLTAIQSQMNPHFLFNALNSIQDLVLKGDVENSYSYITTFSKLVRKTLDYSVREFIGLDEELTLLRLYLSLEQLRFDHGLEDSITLQDVDQDIQLPPFLLQPFVENALKHGLLHKEGVKRLRIQMSLREHLICTIEDNGVGRAAAAAIARRQAKGHVSFAGGAIAKRFAILSEMYGDKFEMHYEDLEEGGVPCGTRVTLRIPVRRMD